MALADEDLALTWDGWDTSSLAYCERKAARAQRAHVRGAAYVVRACVVQQSCAAMMSQRTEHRKCDAVQLLDDGPIDPLWTSTVSHFGPRRQIITDNKAKLVTSLWTDPQGEPNNFLQETLEKLSSSYSIW